MSEWQVVDANILREELLVEFLGRNPGNRAIFTDYACMESYKGHALKNISSSLRLISKYTNQVLVLRSTREIAGMGPVSRQNLIDEEQTADFQAFCAAVSRAESGDSDLRSQIEEHGIAAAENLARLRVDPLSMAADISDIASQFDPLQIRALRRGERLSPNSAQVLIDHVFQMARQAFDTHPDNFDIPFQHELVDTYVFRYSVASYLRALRWIASGGIENATPDRMANDIVDMTHVAFGTYFDGILSNDRLLVDIYDETLAILEALFRPLLAGEP